MKKLLTMALAMSCLLSCSTLTANAEINSDSYASVVGDTVVFENRGDIITSTANKFRIERSEDGRGGFSFIPEEDGRFVVSTVTESEDIIDTQSGSHFHYFYQVVQTYVITKEGETVSIECRQDYNGYDRYAVEELSQSESMVCFDQFSHVEFEDYYYGEYYSLVNGCLPFDCYFTYFDYLYETDDKKDCSQFFIPFPYEPLETAELPEFMGNSRLVKTGYTSSGLGCCDIFDYAVFEPTGDGKTEFVGYDNCNLVISAENRQYIPEISIVEKGEPVTEKSIAGDINGDGKIAVSDMVTLQNYLLSSIKLSASQLTSADVNSDGKVDVFDMIDMRKKFTVN